MCCSDRVLEEQRFRALREQGVNRESVLLSQDIGASPAFAGIVAAIGGCVRIDNPVGGGDFCGTG